MVLPVGASLQCVFAGGRSVDRLVGNLTMGFAFSSLSVRHDSVQSLDPHSRVSLDLTLAFAKQTNLFADVGLASVSYQDTPQNLICAQLGVQFFR